MRKPSGFLAAALAFSSMMNDFESTSRRLRYGSVRHESKTPLTKKQLKSRRKNKLAKIARKKQRLCKIKK